MTLAAGTRLGPYEVLSLLGAGGMGEVYRARDARLEREVAVKVLSAHLVAVTGTTYFDNTQHPNFSAAGAPIQVGFFRANGSGLGSGYTLTAAIDNWQLVFNAGIAPSNIPTLNSLAMGALVVMLAIGGVLLLRRA